MRKPLVGWQAVRSVAPQARAHQTMLAGPANAKRGRHWLDSWFESDLLKATLAFDASGGSLLEPGSALPLAWAVRRRRCAACKAPSPSPTAARGALTRLLGEAVTDKPASPFALSLHVEPPRDGGRPCSPVLC